MLVPWPVIEPGPSALKAENPNLWISRQFMRQFLNLVNWHRWQDFFIQTRVLSILFLIYVLSSSFLSEWNFPLILGWSGFFLIAIDLQINQKLNKVYSGIWWGTALLENVRQERFCDKRQLGRMSFGGPIGETLHVWLFTSNMFSLGFYSWESDTNC